MKHLYLYCVFLLLISCSKDDLYGPSKLKAGQEVEVFVSHKYGAIDDPLLILPANKPAEMSLSSFADREPGYNYRIKAKLVVPDELLQDAPSYWLEYIKVISKDKTSDNTPFDIALIQYFLAGGPIIMVQKSNNQYYFDGDKITLTYQNEDIRKQLEEIWAFNESIKTAWENTQTITPMKWKTIKATVTHDPQSFGKSYLVSRIEFSE